MRLQSTFSQNVPPPKRSDELLVARLLALQHHVAFCTSHVLRLTALRHEWKPWSETIMHGHAGADALDDLADELVGAPVDALDRVAEFRRQRRVVQRMLRIDQPPHHVLHAVGGLDHADEQIPVLARPAGGGSPARGRRRPL